MQNHATRRIALVTGASRGIGAGVARQLADRQFHVIVNYREKAKRANTVVDGIIDAGGRASTLAADISDEVAVAAMIDDVRQHFGRLDVLVLNASGGLERGADPGYAMRLNRDAQKRLAQLAIPLMPVGGSIVFVTSHQAHFYPDKPVPDGYAPIAESKQAGEQALQAMRPEFDRHGVRFTVVSGDMIDGTIIIRLLQRRDPAAVEARRRHAPLPSIDDFAAAIADTAVTPSHERVVYVGGSDYLNDRSA
jgi:NAD(P)-dependent dehydrogenase (short-subunit alcohol dehydrogenase family)